MSVYLNVAGVSIILHLTIHVIRVVTQFSKDSGLESGGADGGWRGGGRQNGRKYMGRIGGFIEGSFKGLMREVQKRRQGAFSISIIHQIHYKHPSLFLLFSWFPLQLVINVGI